MESPTESTYGELQTNERYKKLKRDLKMTLMKEAYKRRLDNGISDNLMSPNNSSLNGDNLDSSLPVIPIYVNNGSEVVSSSTNMRNVLLHQYQKNIPIDRNINNNDRATSSVNSSLLTNDAISKALMPPPKSIGILAHSSRRNSPADTVKQQMNEPTNSRMEHNCGISSPSVYSSIKYRNSISIQDTSQIAFEGKIMDNNHKKNNINLLEKPDRIFSKWRVMLNNNGQLIIKGTLECGKIARSKPVIRRLTAISVQSIFNHIYNLNGNIYDEKNELPDYIRGKFFNGFPDDWENVFQVWRNFIATGSNLNFRWPTPITDSDDDLKSEITEISLPRKIERKMRLRSDSMKNSLQLSTAQSRTRTNEELYNCPQCQCSVASSIRHESKKTPKSNPKSTNDDESHDIINTSPIPSIQHQEFNSSNFTSSPCTPNIHVTSLKDVLPEDKINIIMENLNSKNCSVEYIDKIFQMYDCLRYVMSYRSKNENESESVKSKVASSIKRSVENDGHTPRKFEDSKSNTSHSLAEHTKKNNIIHDDNYNINSYKRISNITGNTNEKSRVRRRLKKNDYESSDSRESDSDYDRPNKSIPRVSRSYGNRTAYKRSVTGRKSTHRCMKNLNDSESDDYIPKKVHPISISPTSNKSKNTNTPVVKLQSTSINKKSTSHHYENLRGTVPVTRSISHRLPQEQSTIIHHHKRANSMSTIGDFLRNYDSSVSITEDESKMHDNKFEQSMANINYERNKMNRVVGKGHHENLRYPNQNYNSSVSITEDEFLEENKENNKTRKIKVLQKLNSQCLQQVMKRTAIGLKHPSSVSQLYERKNLPQVLSEIHEVDEQFRKESSDNEDKVTLNGNKENQSMNAGENRSKKNITIINSHELEVNKQKNAEKMKTTSISPNKKAIPAIVRVENVSTNLNFKHLIKSQSQKILNPHSELKEGDANIPLEIECLRPSKSLDDQRKLRSATDLSLIAAQSEAIPKSKSLTTELQDVKDIMNKKQPENINIEIINEEKGVFGSESNPKRLIAWVPKVLQKSGSNYGLIFEGKLLNEADHIVNRKFATDFISTRISLKIVKTESNEFYKLIGDLTDTKHLLPKELQKLCLNGCPARIPQFCEKWKKLSMNNSNLSQRLLNDSKDVQTMPTSSRGRRILPPLCYWTGERIALKDNQAIYSPGNSQDSSSLSMESSRRDDSQNSSKRNVTSVKDTTISIKTNSGIDIKDKDKEENSNTLRAMNIIENNSKELHKRKTRTKRTLARMPHPVSSDTSDNDVPSNSKRRRSKLDYSKLILEDGNPRTRNQRRRASNRLALISIINPNSIENKKESDKTTLNRENNENNDNKISSAKNTCGIITYKYKKRINRESELSDDQISNM